MSNDTEWQMTQNEKFKEMTHVTWHMTNDDDYDDDDDVDDDDDDDDAKCHEMSNVNVNLWLQAEMTGVTHFGAYNRPQDGNF